MQASHLSLALVPALAAAICIGATASERKAFPTLQEGLSARDRGRVVHLADSPFDQRPFLEFGRAVRSDADRRILARLYKLTWELKSEGIKSIYRLKESKLDRAARARAFDAARAKGKKRILDRIAVVRKDFMTRGVRSDRAGEKRRRVDYSQEGASLFLALPTGLAFKTLQSGSGIWRVSDLPDAAQAAARQVAAGMGKRIRVDGNGNRSPLPSATELLSTVGVLRVWIAGPPEHPTLLYRLSLGAKRGILGNVLYSSVTPDAETPAARRSDVKSRPDEEIREPLLLKRVKLEDPMIRPRREWSGIGRPPKARTFASLFEDLANQIGIPIYAEQEDVKDDPQWLKKQPWLGGDIVDEPLHVAMDLLCADFRCEWEFYEGAILVRPSAWYLEPEARLGPPVPSLSGERALLGDP